MGVVFGASLEGVASIKRMYSAASVRAATEAGLKAAMNSMAQQAQRSADVLVYSSPTSGAARTGDYANSLRLNGPGNLNEINFVQNTIAFGSDLPQAEFLENGTPPHAIYPRKAKALAFSPSIGRATGAAPLRAGARTLPRGAPIFRGAGGGAVSRPGRFSSIVRAHVFHPGTKALHVLQRAVDYGEPIIVLAYVQAFERAMERFK